MMTDDVPVKNEVSGAEKRVAPRAVTDFVVELYGLDTQALLGIARLLNLSVSGACVESTGAFNKDAKMNIRLLLGKRHLLTLPGEVMWVRNLPHTRQYGLKFGEFPENTKDFISKFVNEYFSHEAGTDFLSGPPSDG